MKKDKVPQDDNPTYQGYGTKVMYAVDDGGAYTTVRSSGWEAEEVVLRDVVNDFKDRAETIKALVAAGKASPIEYFMHAKYMDLASLSAGIGMWRWRVKRHLTAKGFSRLNRRILERYAEFFNVSVEQLTKMKESIDVE